MLAPVLLALTLGTADRPGPNSGHCLVYSGVDKGIVLLGGDASDGSRMWLRKDGKWSLLTEKAPQRSLAGAACDPDRSLLLMFGGAKPVASAGGQINWQVTSETWAWDGKTWKMLTDKGPVPRDHTAMVYDESRKRMVLFGGSDADPSGRSVFFGDTWEWDGKAWTQTATAGPLARCHHAMAYDPVRKRTVLAGGFGANGAVDSRTWEWDGKEWRAISANGPATRSSPRMVFHGGLGKVLLFGGEGPSNSLPSDTWSWDGRQWAKVADQGPPGRTVHGLAYDIDTKRLVLFGGALPDPTGDLWEFGSSGWKKG